MIAAFPLASTGTDANVQVRGVSPRALEVRDNVRITAGRFFQPGLAELVVGRNAVRTYAGLGLGSTRALRRRELDGGRGVRRRGQCLRLRGVVRCQRPERGLQATDERVPVGHGAPRLDLRADRVQGRADVRPTALRAGRARDGVLREAVADPDDPHQGAGLPGRHRDGDRRGVRRVEHHVLGGRRAVARDRHDARARVRRRDGRRSRS